MRRTASAKACKLLKIFLWTVGRKLLDDSFHRLGGLDPLKRYTQ